MLVAKVAMVVNRKRAKAERDGVVEGILGHCRPVYKRPASAVSTTRGVRASVREEKTRLVVDVVSDAGSPFARGLDRPFKPPAGTFRLLNEVGRCLYVCGMAEIDASLALESR